MFDVENPINKMIEVKFVKIRENSKLPFKKHKDDAGWDLYFCPDDKNYQNMWHNGKYCTGKLIKPGESLLFQTGLKINFPIGYLMKIDNRSSVASKKKLIIGATIVDPTYPEEIFVNLINVGTEDQFVEIHERIAQFYIIKNEELKISEVSNEEYEKLMQFSTRTGGFGSTN